MHFPMPHVKTNQSHTERGAMYAIQIAKWISDYDNFIHQKVLTN